ncbi:TlpA family protein disulfide reductase [Desertivirga brevis]|uniref:TlpA family protein disulfide reductase n=1 Tax=Desertivirga brevis TaxID=2810310 RepID=UPI001A97A0FF|nr:TlpA disulfide reductase family protein [Pedobacter sp. SYSU D00873]
MMKSVLRMSFPSLSTLLLIGFASLMLFSPEAKSWTIRGLMSIGFFQPNVQVNEKSPAKQGSEVSFRNGDNQVVKLTDLKGKVVVINFWATWCPPCIAEMPSFNRLSSTLKSNKNIVFLMVDVDGNYKKAKKFMERKRFNLPVYTADSSIPESLLDGSIPTTVIFDKFGNLVFRHIGAGDFSSKKVEEYLVKLSEVEGR